ncbi:hypothetical protein NJ76_20185 [Rhodococcus sp. IITR03]|nr:hypothetical protein NJ76_20185 [Rhodococcus sp. IITR03]
MLGQHPLDLLREHIDTVAAAGGTVPDTYTAVNERWKRYLAIGHDISTVLADAITTPDDTSDLTQLRHWPSPNAAEPSNKQTSPKS